MPEKRKTRDEKEEKDLDVESPKKEARKDYHNIDSSLPDDPKVYVLCRSCDDPTDLPLRAQYQYCKDKSSCPLLRKHTEEVRELRKYARDTYLDIAYYYGPEQEEAKVNIDHHSVARLLSFQVTAFPPDQRYKTWRCSYGWKVEVPIDSGLVKTFGFSIDPVDPEIEHDLCSAQFEPIDHCGHWLEIGFNEMQQDWMEKETRRRYELLKAEYLAAAVSAELGPDSQFPDF